MKFALLGADRESVLLASAAVAAGHELAWCGDLGAMDVRGFPWALPDRGEQWEDLHDDSVSEAVIAGRGAVDEATRSRRLQELVRQGRPVLATFPLFDSVLSCFEVDMARGESGAVVRHFNPLAAPDVLRRLPVAGDDGESTLGRIEQITCVRRLSDRRTQSVLNRFARDVELLERLVGGLNRVGAHGPEANDLFYAALSVQLLGAAGAPIRWGVEPPSATEGLTVEWIGERGRLVAEFDAEDMLLRVGPPGENAAGVSQDDCSPERLAARAVDQFVQLLSQSPKVDLQPDPQAEPPNEGRSTWPAALHAMELCDSIEISLRRGRMIEVHAQQLTEELAFRGTMAAAGCGLLVALPPLALAIGWLAGLAGIPVARYWPHAVLATLGLFLALQLLPRLLGKPEDRG